ncbi:hypothetical protein [Salibacterium halotolerans]|uniref:Uncharacterized protein n=1 Tax=Salibacterium halotolerans TaxID=1884432 RepID=A0A1I5URL7_9BACI|nr:hypothetical protein [Salibacterium halotolerans]SFP97895.1 hypothetical protein SAMN05518683_11428 [Salibacterium halotolerans]
MQHILNTEKLQSLLKIEQAVGNAEKMLNTPEAPSSAGQKEQAVKQAKAQLDRAWKYHLNRRWS